MGIEWWKAAGVRAVKTVAQTAVASIGTDLAGIMDVPWPVIASTAALAGVLSLLTSVVLAHGGSPNPLKLLLAFRLFTWLSLCNTSLHTPAASTLQ